MSTPSSSLLIRDLIDGDGSSPGFVELTGNPAGLALRAKLALACGEVEDDLLRFSDMPLITGPATVDGELVFARIFSGASELVVSGMTMGAPGSEAAGELLDGTAKRVGEGVLVSRLTIRHA